MRYQLRLPRHSQVMLKTMACMIGFDYVGSRL